MHYCGACGNFLKSNCNSKSEINWAPGVKKKLETAKGSALMYWFKGKPTVQNAMFAEVVD